MRGNTSVMRIVRVFILIVLFVAAIGGLQVYSVYSRNLCEQSQQILSKDAAVLFAKQVAVQRNLIRFSELGDTARFVDLLNRNSRCCGAWREFSWQHMTNLWEVAMSAEGEYHAIMTFTECGKVLSTGTQH